MSQQGEVNLANTDQTQEAQIGPDLQRLIYTSVQTFYDAVNPDEEENRLGDYTQKQISATIIAGIIQKEILGSDYIELKETNLMNPNPNRGIAERCYANFLNIAKTLSILEATQPTQSVVLEYFRKELVDAKTLHLATLDFLPEEQRPSYEIVFKNNKELATFLRDNEDFIQAVASILQNGDYETHPHLIDPWLKDIVTNVLDVIERNLSKTGKVITFDSKTLTFTMNLQIYITEKMQALEDMYRMIHSLRLKHAIKAPLLYLIDWQLDQLHASEPNPESQNRLR